MVLSLLIVWMTANLAVVIIWVLYLFWLQLRSGYLRNARTLLFQAHAIPTRAISSLFFSFHPRHCPFGFCLIKVRVQSLPWGFWWFSSQTASQLPGQQYNTWAHFIPKLGLHKQGENNAIRSEWWEGRATYFCHVPRVDEGLAPWCMEMPPPRLQSRISDIETQLL